MSATSPMNPAGVFRLLVTPALSLLLVLPPAAPVHAQATEIGAGQSVSGVQGVQNRNHPVRIGAGAYVEGPVESRNGVISIGNGADVGSVISRNGRVTLGRDVRAGRVSSRNGRVEIGDFGEIRDVDTRNGHIEIGAFTVVDGRVESRNGNIRLGERATVRSSIETRNGELRLGAGTRVRGSATTRNGRISLEPGTAVDGNVRTRNGGIHLDAAAVGGDLETYSGDVSILNGSAIEGDVIVLLPEDRGWSFFGFRSRGPTVRIASDARIGGRLIVDERARLHIEDGAEVPAPERYPSREAWDGR